MLFNETTNIVRDFIEITHLVKAVTVDVFLAYTDTAILCSLLFRFCWFSRKLFGEILPLYAFVYLYLLIVNTRISRFSIRTPEGRSHSVMHTTSP